MPRTAISLREPGTATLLILRTPKPVRATLQTVRLLHLLRNFLALRPRLHHFRLPEPRPPTFPEPFALRTPTRQPTASTPFTRQGTAQQAPTSSTSTNCQYCRKYQPKKSYLLGLFPESP